MNKILVVLTLLAVVFSGCSQPEAVVSGKLKVMASMLPIYAHAKSIAGDVAEVELLLPPETDPHDYEAKPGDVLRLSQADLFIINGAGVETWLDDLVKEAGKPALVVVDSGKGIPLLEGGEAMMEGVEEAHDHHEHGHEGANPHIWLDPVNAQSQTKAILEALVKADPAHEQEYRDNAAVYLAKLEQLDADYRAALEPLKDKNLVTFHDAFPYLAKRYGIHYLGYVEEFPEKDPTPGDLKKLFGLIRDSHVQVVFTEVGYSPRLLEALARETGVKISQLDTLEMGEPSADAYLVRMRNNLENLRHAWQ